ncbi:MAG TPA: phosphoribosylanthranilate isomerase [Candidatus Eisenbacteria bacterium]|nr:phosphoribosylanthranilate isomerase [Candidatus Eisenbacteria bacterium]
MTWVKICGMTNLADALVAVEAGADAVGFVFYGKSPRNVTVERAREIVEKLPEGVEKVGVFVNSKVEDAKEIFHQAGMTMVQVYGKSVDEWYAWYESDEMKLMWAIPGSVLTGEFLISMKSYRKKISAVLVDSGSGDRPGGTGTRFDWEGTKIGIWNLGSEVPIVVAGGLTPENVNNAMRTLAPWGVDVVSGVEASPGKKDSGKVRAFVRAVREFDRRVG